MTADDDRGITLGELSRALSSFISATDKRFEVLERSTVSVEIYGLKNAQIETEIAQLHKSFDLGRMEHEKDVQRLEKMAEQRERQYDHKISKLESWREAQELRGATHRERDKSDEERRVRKREMIAWTVSALLTVGLVLGTLGLHI